MKKVVIIIKANKDEVVDKDKDKDEVGGPMTTTTTSKEEEAQKEVMGKATQDLGMTSQI